MSLYRRLGEVVKTPSRPAINEARDKLSYTAFKDLFDKSCSLASQSSETARVYKGYRLLSVDGTSFPVGPHEKLREYFGDSTTIPGKAMCRIGAIVDVLNDCIVMAKVTKFSEGERAIAIEQVKALKEMSNALYIFDRGYWSPDLVASIDGNGQKFIIRLSSKVKNPVAKDDNDDTINLRKVSFTLPNGKSSTLVTNLSEEEITDEELAELYTKRWGIETKYYELKERLQINKLSREAGNAILQDIYATLYISNLVAFICFEVDAKLAQEESSSKYERKAKRAVCISAIRDRFVTLCLHDHPAHRALELDILVADLRSEITYSRKSSARVRKRIRRKASCRGAALPVL